MKRSLWLSLPAFVVAVLLLKLLEWSDYPIHNTNFTSFHLAEDIAVTTAAGLLFALFTQKGAIGTKIALAAVTAFALFGAVVYIQDLLGRLDVTYLGDAVIQQTGTLVSGWFVGLELVRRNAFGAQPRKRITVIHMSQS